MQELKKKRAQIITPEMQKAVRRLRGELQLSQGELAELLGVSRPTVFNIENVSGQVVYPKTFNALQAWLMEHV